MRIIAGRAWANNSSLSFEGRELGQRDGVILPESGFLAVFFRRVAFVFQVIIWQLDYSDWLWYSTPSVVFVIILVQWPLGMDCECQSRQPLWSLWVSLVDNMMWFSSWLTGSSLQTTTDEEWAWRFGGTNNRRRKDQLPNYAWKCVIGRWRMATCWKFIG